MTVDFIQWQIINFKYLKSIDQLNIQIPISLVHLFSSQMPRLRKTVAENNSEQSQSIGKYLSFQDKQTQEPSPIGNLHHTQDSKQDQAKKRKASAKKTNRSLKKKNRNEDEELLQNEQVNKKKSKSKIGKRLPQKKEVQNQKQNENQQNSLSQKLQKREKSLGKSKRSANKRKFSEQKEQREDNQQQFKDNQLRQKDEQQDPIELKISDASNSDTKSNRSENQSDSSINFNRRLKKKKQTQRENLGNLLSRYTEDESLNFGNNLKQDDDSNGQIGTKYQSDLRGLEMMVKKKQKKQKKEKQVKIKNKYFSDLSFDPQSAQTNIEGSQPPENSEELIFEKREPRKSLHNLNEIIQKRVNHIKDRREFKSSEGDLKFKNHLKMKLQQVKDVEEIEVDIEVPNLFSKKTTSAALYMKNTMEAQQKNAKRSQANSEISKNPLHKTSSASSLNNSQQFLTNQQKKNQQYQILYKKKGVRRQDFFNHLTKEIKTKKQTSIYSQEMKDCFKTSTLDEENFDADLADDVLSNCSGRSATGQSGHRLLRKMSGDSQLSRKSQASSKSIKSGVEQNQCSISSSIGRGSSKWNIDMGQNSVQNSSSKLFNTNKSSKRFSTFENPSISEVKQSDASSSIRSVDNSCSFGSNLVNESKLSNSPKFDDKTIKEEVEKSFRKSYKVFQSDNQIQQNDRFLSKENENSLGKTPLQIVQQQRQSDRKLTEKLKKMTKNKKQKKLKSKEIKNKKVEYSDDLLEDNLDQRDQQSMNLKKKNKKCKKNKSKKKKQDNNNYQSYFQVQAEYSSSEQGHTDPQNQQNESDIDEQGNIIGLIDWDAGELSNNERLVRKKFLDDQQKKDQQIIERLMQGMYGRKKMEETDSERRLRKRMQDAAKRNLLEDLEQKNTQVNQIPTKTEEIPQDNLQIQPILDEDSREKRKLKELENQLMYGGLRDLQNEKAPVTAHKNNQAWNLLTAMLPKQNNHHLSVIVPSGLREKAITGNKTNNNRKSIFDTKKNNVQQQIYHKRISLDKQRGESTGNRNKIQKITSLNLDIRNTNVKFDEDVQI